MLLDDESSRGAGFTGKELLLVLLALAVMGFIFATFEDGTPNEPSTDLQVERLSGGVP